MSFSERLSTFDAGSARVTSGTARNVSSIRRIIIHHTTGSSRPANRPYHFCVDQQGRIFYEHQVQHIAPHAGDHNANSIGIAAIGNFSNLTSPTSPITPTPQLRAAMARIVADCLINFPNISPRNLTLPYQVDSVGRVVPGNPRSPSTESGILGHWAVSGAQGQTECPGVNLNHRAIINDAIHMAETFTLLEGIRTRRFPNLGIGTEIPSSSADIAAQANAFGSPIRPNTMPPTFSIGRFIANVFNRSPESWRYERNLRPSGTGINGSILTLGNAGLIPRESVAFWQEFHGQFPHIYDLIIRVARFVP